MTVLRLWFCDWGVAFDIGTSPPLPLLKLMSFDIAREKEKKLKFFDIFVNDL